MPIRIGIIGAGRMGNNHTGHLLNNPEAQVVAAADILPERAEALAARTGGRAYTDYREMLDKEALDAVYVCTPTRGHAEHAVAVAERKLALFVEKPLAATMAEAWQIARAVKRGGRHLVRGLPVALHGRGDQSPGDPWGSPAGRGGRAMVLDDPADPLAAR